MATEYERQLTVQAGARVDELRGERASHNRVRGEEPPGRDAFVSGLVDDLTTLLREFEESFETGRR